jgi:hypothetical protein
MKHFILTGVILFVLAVVATVAVFFIARSYVVPADITTLKDEVGTKIQDSLGSVTDEGAKAVSDVAPSLSVGEGGLPLSSLNIEGAQKKALEAAGINTETFVITEAMLVCAREAVGDDRVVAYVGGESPTILEVGKLLPCLGAN